MNVFSTTETWSTDCRLCIATVAGIYSPLLVILAAALFAF